MNRRELSQLRFLRRAVHQANHELKQAAADFGFESPEYLSCFEMMIIDRESLTDYMFSKTGKRRT